jgi:hypothetical protein
LHYLIWFDHDSKMANVIFMKLVSEHELWSNVPMNEEQKRLAESQRILRQVNRDSDHAGFAPIDRLQNHLSANDIDKADPLEVWGTRFGRSLGLVIMVSLLLAIIVWFGAARP